MLPEEHKDWGWKPGPRLPTWKEDEQQMAPFQLTKSQKNPHKASDGKVMLMLFWGHQFPLIERYMSKGTTVTSVLCRSLLRNHLRPAIISKLRGLLSTGFFLRHGNARPHIAIWLLKRSGTFIWSGSFISHSHLTSPHVTTLSLGHWRRYLVERLSDPMKKCKRQLWVTVHETKGFFSH
jgi:hypothetical protein